MERRAQDRSLAALQRASMPNVPGRSGFVQALTRDGLSLIAEHKRRSPSQGALNSRGLNETLTIYELGHADLFSILTEEDHFSGSLDDLVAASAFATPALRKDFIIDPYMIFEARAFGASAILLLANVLSEDQLCSFTKIAHDLNLAVLLEIHDEGELTAAEKAQPDAIGVNARDLTTFQVDLSHTTRIIQRISSDYIRVAESGIKTPLDAKRAQDAGADALLVGTALMRSESPAKLIRSLKLMDES